MKKNKNPQKQCNPRSSYDPLFKICPKCKVKYERTPLNFHRASRKKDGLDTICKKCKREYRIANRERYNENMRAWKRGNKKHYLSNRKWILANREKHRKIVREYCSKRESKDIEFKVMRRLRSRVRSALIAQGTYKKERTVSLLGCSVEYFKLYMESLFKEGMTWQNMGNGGWWIDHIRPCASFDLTDPEEQKKCFHYTNLQPIWAIENMEKGSLYNGKRIYKKRIIKKVVTLSPQIEERDGR